MKDSQPLLNAATKKRAAFPFIAFVALVLAVHGLVVATHTEFRLTQLTMALYYALVVLGLCLLMGYAGQVSLGHGAFFAAGGYTSAVLTTRDLTASKGAAWFDSLQQLHVLATRTDPYGASIVTVAPWAAMFAALLVTFCIAALIGYPALRLRGHYLAMATLGFGLIVSKIVVGSTILGSADGINGVPPLNLPFGLTVTGGKPLRVQNYYVAAALVLLALLVLSNVVRSRIGRALLALHDKEMAAATLGINTAGYKLKVFIMSALLAGLAGVFFTHYTSGISPSEAGAIKSVRYVALVAAGGMSNLWGVAAASILLNYLSLRGVFGSFDHAVFGAILILVVSLAPEGPIKPLWAKAGAFLRKRFSARSRRAVGTATERIP